jgi:Na+/H+-dicarboxylate symporter
MRLSTLILAALAAGTIAGALLNRFFAPAIAPLDHYLLSPLAQAFLRLIQFVVVPIVFSSLILGLSRIGQAGQLGRYLVKLLTCYLLTSFIALCLGMSTAGLLKPGLGVSGVTLGQTAIATQAPS